MDEATTQARRWLKTAIELLGAATYNRSNDGMSVRRPKSWHDAEEARWTDERRTLIRACYDTLEPLYEEQRRATYARLADTPPSPPAQEREG